MQAIIPQDTAQQHPHTPEKLKKLPKWMGARFEHRPDGKLNKPPYRIRPGRPAIKADKTNPKNWTTFEKAYKALSMGDVDAIGFVFTGEDRFCVVDLDEVLDPETGEIGEEASKILASFEDTYAELSVSGEGIHIVCEAEKPGDRCKKDPVELYDGGSGARFVVITGTQLSRRTDISPCQSEINALYERVFGEEAARWASRPARRTHEAAGRLDREELLEKARNSRTGAQFRKLYDRGDRTGYDSPNEADYALINTLIFWCPGDRDLVEELFRESALYRPPPEKHKGYVGISIRNALASYKGSFYKPKALREKSTQDQLDVLNPYLSLLLDASLWKGQKAAGGFKAYAALVTLAVEDGIATDVEELRVGADVRNLAERAGLNRVTLCRSSLPYLTQDLKLVRWRRGEGNKAGEFVLRKPDFPSEATTKVSTQYFSGSTYGDGLDALKNLIRMRSGVSRTGKVTHLGEMQTVARLGMVAMFAMVTLTAHPRGLKAEEFVERMGRRRDHVLSALRKLEETQILTESREGFFTFADGFWAAYKRSLISSGIIASEHRQRRQHERERRDREMKLEEGRAQWHAKRDEKVISLDAERRRKEDKEAARNQPTDQRHETPRQKEEREERPMLEEYDRKIERCMDRLGEVFAARDERRRARRA
jgi:hypothetical protein